MGAILERLTSVIEIPECVTRSRLRVASDSLSIVGICLITMIPAGAGLLMDSLLAYTNLIVGPIIALLVTLWSFDSNSVRALRNASPDTQKLFGSMLTVSYTLYLTHWPFALMMKSAGVFSDDSWGTVLGMFSTSILFSTLMDACLVKPFTRWVDARVPLYMESRRAGHPNEYTSQVTPTMLGQPTGHGAEVCETKDVARDSVRLARHASRDSTGVQQVSILDPSRSSSFKSTFDQPNIDRELVASIMQLERNLFLATHGTTELDHVDANVDEGEVEVVVRSRTASLSKSDGREVEDHSEATAEV
jgi:hypothetical protein